MTELTIVQKIAVWAIPVIFAITVHEVAHGWVASKLGDQTARLLGRLTLNPFKHVDPVGTIGLPLILMVVRSPFIFGWAKPVPVDWRNFRKPKRDMALVAIAGPGANFLMLIMWAVFAKVVILTGGAASDYSIYFIYLAEAGIIINAVLMVLNLIPIPPLDGSRVVASFLPPHLEQKYSRLEQYGFMILLLLLATGILGKIMGPIIYVLLSMTYTVIGM